MKLSEAKYTRRFNLGDYEHEEYTLSCVADDGDEGKELLQELKTEVLDAHTTEKKEGKENAKSSSSKNSNKNGKSSTKKASGSDDESSEDDETSNAETSDDDNDSAESNESEDGEDSGDEEETKSAKGGKANSSKAPKEEKGKKSFKRKPQSYDRNIEQHKEIFAGVVRSIDPDWKKSDDKKKKVKKISVSVEGEAFLDINGEVLPEFKAKVKKLLK